VRNAVAAAARSLLAYIHTGIHTYIQAYIHTYIHTNMHTYIHAERACHRTLAGASVQEHRAEARVFDFVRAAHVVTADHVRFGYGSPAEGGGCNERP